MKQVGIVTLISVAASAAAPVAHARADAVTLETNKTVAQFGGCFVGTQDRAARAWAFVPKDDGGTFSNAGARGAQGFYYLAISDRGPIRQVRLEAASASSPLDRNIARAVDQCI
jgi:threonine aldolase